MTCYDIHRRYHKENLSGLFHLSIDLLDITTVGAVSCITAVTADHVTDMKSNSSGLFAIILLNYRNTIGFESHQEKAAEY
jgi:hypothetical protein